jgi:hypothetical protein
MNYFSMTFKAYSCCVILFLAKITLLITQKDFRKPSVSHHLQQIKVINIDLLDRHCPRDTRTENRKQHDRSVMELAEQLMRRHQDVVDYVVFVLGLVTQD